MHRVPVCTAVFFVLVAGIAQAAEPVDIGTRRELFVDSHLIDRLQGDAGLKLQRPQPQEVVLVTDQPWEGNTCAYYTIFQDGDLYRMYYRGSHYNVAKGERAHREVTCYAESKDGVHWTKPNLGLFEFEGSKANNIVWDGIGTHCFVAFKDTNPACPKDARYKGISRGRPQGKRGLYVFKSPDAIHWSLMHNGPVITTGAFDSQNLAFWDSYRGLYVAYHRIFHADRRAIMTATSGDFVHWTEPQLLKYSPGTRNEHLYTNAIRRYERAPHMLIGFPTRFLAEQGSRVEPVFMSSRDGRTFRRFVDPVIPEDAPQDRTGNRSNYMTWGLVQLPGNDRELSVYATEAYYTGPDSRVRRFTYRVDGFVSAHSSGSGGVVTEPLTFAGRQLEINYATGNGGSVRVEVQDADGKPIQGLALSDCVPMQSDSIEAMVRWNGGVLDEWIGKPVRIRFALENADLYSYRFRE